MTYYKRNLLILCSTIGLASLSWTQIIPFLPRYLIQLGVKDHLTAWSALVLGAQSVAAIVFMPFWGKMGDKYGRKPMVIRAGFCLSGIYLGMTLCSAPWHLLVFRFLNGMLTGFLPGSYALIGTNTPNDRSGRYVAIAQSAAAIGGIAGPICGGLLADFTGIRGTMLVSGSFVFLSTCAVALLVKEPRKPRPGKPTTLIEDFLKCVREPTLRFVMSTNWISAIIGGSVTSTLTIYLLQLQPGLAATAQGAIFTIPGILLALLALRWVRFGERVTYRRVIMIGLTGTGISFVLMGVSINLWMFVPAFICCRVFASALNPTVSAIVSRDVDEEYRGRAFGIQTSVTMVGDLAAQSLVALVGQTMGIHVLYIVIGAGVLTMGIRGFVRMKHPLPVAAGELPSALP